ncbi:hypothetical protein DPSP01_010905 [Paraphaeosphaeria sporulosa]|uniref:HAD-like protein n=1 Tax=Paraphaeosphaeria sporulosa TaxID=1460663 RepID=A0A177C9R3_9PLEO|nr:HAD-like protein [Paraphaeosphaeria sporulosa]OAG04126.1 HAD-like protein [Paraphaeosphaeria sporulosa]
MLPYVPIIAVIFDLGDVFFQWSRTTKTEISPGMMKKILNSTPWCDYECGRITQAACYESVAQQFRVDVCQVCEAFDQARASLKPDAELVSFIKDLRRQRPIKVYAMSNIAKEDFATLGDKIDLELFDDIFTSGEHGRRKPELDFYREVLMEIDLRAEEVLFVDDRVENVRAARNIGIRGLVFDDKTTDTLKDQLFGPIVRGYEWLHRSGCDFESVTDSGVCVGDNFAKLLIVETTQNSDIVHFGPYSKGTWNFFSGPATLVPGGIFPDDLDTTSLALAVLPPPQPEEVTSILDRMAEYVMPDGSFLTYFDKERPRIDAVVNANILACFYRFGRGHEFPHTYQYVRDVIERRSYLDGTRYYPSADCCLGFFTRLLQSAATDTNLQCTLRPLLGSRLKERVAKNGNALDLAMRIIACTYLGVECSVDREALLAMQLEDGSWEPGWIYRYGSTGVKLGNRGATTAFALKAISSSTIGEVM